MLEKRLRRKLKPDGIFSERAARMCQDLLRLGVPIDQMDATIRTVFLYGLGVDLKDIDITFDPDTVEALSVAASELDRAGGQETSESAGRTRRMRQRENKRRTSSDST